MTTLSAFNTIAFILLIASNYVSSAQHSGILSNLYKKASQENRPLILVLDNSQNSNALTGKSRDVDSLKYLDYTPKKSQEPTPKKHSILNQDSFTDKEENQKSLPYILLQHLKNSENRDPTSRPKPHDHGQSRSRLRNRNRDRLRSRFDREDRDRTRDEWDSRDDPLRAFIEKNLKDPKDDRNPEEKERDDQHQRALRSSVIKNLLRISNDLNCDAQDQCADACSDNYNGKKKNACENKCEDKFECSDKKAEKKGCETGDCDLEDECAQDDENCGDDNVSTRGERWEEVTEKCKRC